ncbi:hypothetical protein PQC06_gp069 [Aeromonas phage LAh10]|uniref:Uncharacterized protein n=1 Tax=Aeromonas phage LAh10 TaxID=2591025 RepID=A0A514A1Y0_9CAUD|nr:hypothetical protein PQC06_gp069 [Aeromonas phage LAh10]QDH47232.1 hypothetical protein LAh10_69 [Aeromonas phage LAh10]
MSLSYKELFTGRIVYLVIAGMVVKTIVKTKGHDRHIEKTLKTTRGSIQACSRQRVLLILENSGIILLDSKAMTSGEIRAFSKEKQAMRWCSIQRHYQFFTDIHPNI